MTGVRSGSAEQPWVEASCRLYGLLLPLYPGELFFRYGDEMREVFREELAGAVARDGACGAVQVWWLVLRETVLHLGPAVTAKLMVGTGAVVAALVMALVPAMLVRPVRFPPLRAPHVPAVHAAVQGPAVRRQVTVAPGVELEVLDWGGMGRPLVFLAGLGSDAHAFDRFAPQFTNGYHVLGITRRGFGESSKPPATVENYRADRLGEDVLLVLRALHLEHAVLAGHSIAGEELSSIGSRHPEQVAGLIYLDAADGYGFYNAARGDWQLDTNEVRAEIEAMAKGAPLGVASMRELQASAARLARSSGDVAEDLTMMPAHEGPPPTLPPVALAIRFGEQKYTTLHTPVLAIFACPHSDAPMFGNRVSAERTRVEARNGQQCRAQAAAFQAGVPQADVVMVPGADHWVFVSNPGETAAAMRAFLQKLPPVR